MLGGGAFRSEPAPVAKPSPAVLAAGGLRVQAPEGWARSAPVALAGLSHALWLRDEAAKIDAAIALVPAVSPTLLPAGLRPVGAPRVQQLGAHTAWRYRTETSTGAPAIFFVAPTTSGIATVGLRRGRGRHFGAGLPRAGVRPSRSPAPSASSWGRVPRS